MSPRKRSDKPYGGQITTPIPSWLDSTATEPQAQGKEVQVKLKSIHLPREQPRKYFDSQAQNELIASVQQHGILQPLLVRPLSRGSYELVAGERRLRAAQEVGLTQVPVVVQDLSDEQAFQLALIENLQREDLNPIEETEGILRLLAIRLGRETESLPTWLRQLFNTVARGNLETDNNVIIKDKSSNSKPDNHVIIKSFSESQTSSQPMTAGEIEANNNAIANDSSQSQADHHVMIAEDLQAHLAQVEEVFQQLGLMSWQSFVTNRLPLLNLPPEIVTALRQGQIAYTKAKALGKVKDEELRKELLASAIASNWSLSQIKAQALARSQSASPQSRTEQLSERLKSVYQKVKKSKIADHPKKQKKLENLLQKLETLLAE